MPQQGSVTHLIRLMKEGDSEAVRRLWDHYFPRLVTLARAWLRGLPRGPADEEDVALSALNRFFLSARRGLFTKLEDRDDLWQLLVVHTERKAIDWRRREQSGKRGAGQVHDEAWVLSHLHGELANEGLGGFSTPEPTPEEAAVLAEEFGLLLHRLNDDGLRAVALAKMEGHTNEEVAAELGCGVRTIERKLRLIRMIWEEHAADGREPGED